jgi:hypothetical protein
MPHLLTDSSPDSILRLNLKLLGIRPLIWRKLPPAKKIPHHGYRCHREILNSE